MNNKIYQIAITGGPCAGKTTVLSYLKEKLEQRGCVFIMVPESATLCINAGISPVIASIGVETAQRAITTLAYHMENVFKQAAEVLVKKSPVVILYDRGIVDSSAYAPAEMYKKILGELGLNPIHVRDQRYQAVIHLVTAAEGAEDFYTLANNKARYETPEMARTQDRKIIAAWTGHEHLRVIDNSTDFAGKVKSVYAEILALLGEPPVEDERKFLVVFDRDCLSKGVAAIEPIDIEQFYLVTSNDSVIPRLRCRGQNGFNTYYHAIKQSLGPGKNFETQEIVSENEFEFGRKFMRMDTGIVRKVRNCFVYNSQYFEYDEFKDSRIIPDPATGLLEIEITDSEKPISFPAGITIIREVTGDPFFSNFEIAKRLA